MIISLYILSSFSCKINEYAKCKYMHVCTCVLTLNANSTYSYFMCKNNSHMHPKIFNTLYILHLVNLSRIRIATTCFCSLFILVKFPCANKQTWTYLLENSLKKLSPVFQQAVIFILLNPNWICEYKRMAHVQVLAGFKVQLSRLGITLLTFFPPIFYPDLDVNLEFRKDYRDGQKETRYKNMVWILNSEYIDKMRRWEGPTERADSRQWKIRVKSQVFGELPFFPLFFFSPPLPSFKVLFFTSCVFFLFHPHP